MSRGSQIAIGITTLLGAAAVTVAAPIAGPTAPAGVAGLLALALFLWVVTAACFFRRGRRVTLRITAGGASVACLWVAGSAITRGAVEPRSVGLFLLWLGCGVGAASYTLTGSYPRWLPLSEVFGGGPRQPSP